MNKRALSETIVVLLIFVIGAVILLTFNYALAGQLKENTDIETCRLSVLVQSQTRKLPGLGVSTPGTIIDLDCPRRNLKIFENKVEINGKKSQKYEFKKLSEAELNHIIAEELRLCWYKMVEGNKDVFEHSYFVGVDRTCLICTEIEFSDKIETKSFGGLLNYLKSKKIPKANIPYFEYIDKPQRNLYLLNLVPWTQWTPWGKGTTEKVSEESLNPEEKYSIHFLAYKPAAFNQVIGALSTAYYIGLTKESNIFDKCSKLVN